jgi:hypothetical protein
MRTGGGVVVTRVSTARMAPATAGDGSTEGASRTTFVVGKITRRQSWRSEIRSVEPKAGLRRERTGGAETVH